MYKKRRNSIITLSLTSIAAIAIFLGVTSAQAQTKATIKIPKDTKEAAPSSETPIEEAMKAEESEAEEETGQAEYSYDPTDKVDPFKSFIIVRRELEEKREQERQKPKTYLETLDISQLTVSAIVLSEKGDWALLRDSKGDGHVVEVGTPVGNKGGTVVKILDKELIVREYYTDIRGQERIPKDVSIQLPAID